MEDRKGRGPEGPEGHISDVGCDQKLSALLREMEGSRWASCFGRSLVEKHGCWKNLAYLGHKKNRPLCVRVEIIAGIDRIAAEDVTGGLALQGCAARERYFGDELSFY
ncbi:MAG: hypothetical protein FWG03_05530 [Clostridiales bacterium]|nr:hypothetical protein [Clostridiales bacterium]